MQLWCLKVINIMRRKKVVEPQSSDHMLRKPEISKEVDTPGT